MGKSNKKRKNTVSNNTSVFDRVAPNGARVGTFNNQIKTLENYIRSDFLTRHHQTLSYLYAQEGLVNRIIQVVVDDALHGGIVYESEDTEIVSQLQNLENKLKVIKNVRHLFYWVRLYGGGAILIDDGEPLDKELDLSYIAKGQRLYIDSVSRWQISNSGDNFFHIGNSPIHKSKVLDVSGTPMPYGVGDNYGYWGMSVIDVVASALTPYLKSFNNLMELLDEIKIDVYKIKDLQQSVISRQAANRIQKAIEDMNVRKNIFNGIYMDAEDSFEQKKMGDTGFRDFMPDIRMRIAMATGIPGSRLFGTGTDGQGFQTGEADIAIYNTKLETLRAEIRPVVDFLVSLMCKVLGAEKVNWDFGALASFRPETEHAQKLSTSTVLLDAYSRGIVSRESVVQNLNALGAFPVELDEPSDDEPTPFDQFSNQGSGF